jgi:phosphotransferase system HPr (HPr) family protein
VEKIKVKVLNEVGLHARPAARFVSKANEFTSDIQVKNVTNNSKWVNAKSILSVLLLGVEKDHEIEIIAEGEDEAEAVKQIVELVNNCFGE